MAISYAVAVAQLRDLKDRLVMQGFTVDESQVSGFPKLTINTDEASFLINQEDAVSKDVFGNALAAFTPHRIIFSSRNNAMSTLVVAKLIKEISKMGMRIVVKTHATVLATAEAAAGDLIEFDVRWPAKGI
jgi:hypothetical protein